MIAPDGNVIETEGLTKRYRQVAAVDALDLRVRRHQITGFLGCNGAGKSTTVKMLLGMTHPTSGTATLLGRPIADPKANRLARRQVAYVAEDKHLYGYLTVAEMVRFTRSFYADWRPDVADGLLAQYQLPPSQKIRTLSKGMRTKLALLLALARSPALLLLDEPSEGLDPVTVEGLLRVLVAAAADGVTVFFSSHQIAEIERIADRVVILDRGKQVLDLAMDDLRRDFRRITLGFPSVPPPREFIAAEARSFRTSGRQVTILAAGDAEGIAARGRALGAISVDVAPVDLREVFLDVVGAAA